MELLHEGQILITIRLEKNSDAVWLSIDDNDWAISREAFTQLCFGLEKFDTSSDTLKEIRLDVSDDDFEEYDEGDEG